MSEERTATGPACDPTANKAARAAPIRRNEDSLILTRGIFNNKRMSVVGITPK